jgi:hypothetical protein
MSSLPVIVGYDQIEKALRGDRSRGMAEARSAAAQAVPDSPMAKQLVAELNQALFALEAAQLSPSVLSSPHNQMAATLQSWVAERSLESGKLEEQANGRLEAKFDQNDWAGWVKSFFSWFNGIEKYPFLPPGASGTLPTKFRVGVLGDWGTGMYGAPICSRTIEQDGHFDLLIHLGDVYYAGTAKEETNRFLNLWPNVSGAQNFSLNSNHEMYSGGRGYFEVLLQDARFRNCQKSSCFSLSNEYFIFVGLDTAYKEHDLIDEELLWLKNLIDTAESRKIVLFSHHQPFSSLSGQGPKLQRKLSTLLQNGRIFAWYWGHEHRCVIYEKHDQWRMYGRCVGHSGFPEFRGIIPSLPNVPTQARCWRQINQKLYAPAAIVLDGPNIYITDDPEKYLPHGYMTLEVDGPSLVEHVHSPEGEKLYSALLT